VNRRHHERLSKLLGSGEAVIGGESDAAECYIAPTVLRKVRPDAPIMQEEIFGPILPILSVPSVDAAIDFVKRGEKPLALYVFSDSDAVAQRGGRDQLGRCLRERHHPAHRELGAAVRRSRRERHGRLPRPHLSRPSATGNRALRGCASTQLDARRTGAEDEAGAALLK
jgi:acyl-CoA reductase-like NAD-dependent aldehyde dehydrogenase